MSNMVFKGFKTLKGGTEEKRLLVERRTLVIVYNYCNVKLLLPFALTYTTIQH